MVSSMLSTLSTTTVTNSEAVPSDSSSSSLSASDYGANFVSQTLTDAANSSAVQAATLAAFQAVGYNGTSAPSMSVSVVTSKFN